MNFTRKRLIGLLVLTPVIFASLLWIHSFWYWDRAEIDFDSHLLGKVGFVKGEFAVISGWDQVHVPSDLRAPHLLIL